MEEFCTICVAKTKALISFAVTAKLICAFVFAYADCWYSHAAAQISFVFTEVEIPKGRNAQRLEAKAKTKNKASELFILIIVYVDILLLQEKIL